MSPKFLEKQSTRREMLRNSAGVCGKRVTGATFSGKSSERWRFWPPAAGGNRSNRPSRGHAGADGCYPDPGATAGGKNSGGQPLADLDPVWGHGMLSSDFFVQMVYSAR
jgi:hypothetical protein